MADTKRILSVGDWERNIDRAQALKILIENSGRDFQKVIESFNNEEIVNSLYASGKFGATQKARVEQLMNALNKYFNVVNNGDNSLVAQTIAFANTQIQLLENGTETSMQANETTSQPEIYVTNNTPNSTGGYYSQ